MVGKQSGVETQLLKEHNPEMVPSLHYGAHRLALASSQAAQYISYLKNLMHTSLHFIIIIIISCMCTCSVGSAQCSGCVVYGPGAMAPI